MTVQQIITDIIKREGGLKYEHVPGDRGGPTKAGITLGRLRSERGAHITADDVRNLTEAEIRKIYENAYYWRPRIDRLPDALEPVVMDFYVTSGAWAIKRLQRLLNLFGHKCAVDGGIGPQTVRAAYEVCSRVPMDVVINAYCEERAAFYRLIVANDSTQNKFIRGWLNRAASFIITGGSKNVAQGSGWDTHSTTA